MPLCVLDHKNTDHLNFSYFSILNLIVVLITVSRSSL